VTPHQPAAAHYVCGALLRVVSAVALLVFNNTTLYSQLASTADALTTRPDLRKHGWLIVADSAQTSVQKFITKYSSRFGLADNDALEKIVSHTDKNGWTHTKYLQHYRGIPIEGADVVFHADKSGNVRSVNGKFVTGLTASGATSVSVARARELALAYLTSDEYAWENESQEAMIKLSTGKAYATYYPTPTLVFTRNADTLAVEAKNLVLAYRVDIHSVTPSYAYRIYLDPTTGNELRRTSLRSGNCNPTTATAYTVYNGQQTIHTEEIPQSNPTRYRLYDPCRRIQTKYESNDVTNQGTTWYAALDGFTQAHWGAMRTYDYFQHGLGRAGGPLDTTKVMVQIVDDGTTAPYYTPGVAILPHVDANSRYCHDYMTNLDVVGHEWTHGFIENTLADLENQGASEAKVLNEGFADIFGEMVECYVGAQSDQCGTWKAGGECTSLESNYPRNLKEPTASQGARTYCGLNWNGDVYAKSGVLARWFYLLTEGDTASNDHCCYPITQQNFIVVDGIGTTIASDICYAVLTNGYLTSASDFVDASIATAYYTDLEYGTPALYSVINAWHAVGVYEGLGENACGTFDAYNSPAVAVSTRANRTCIPPLGNGLWVKDNGHLTITSGRYLHMRTGTRVDVGGYFHARIQQPCSTWVAKVGGTSVRESQLDSRLPLSHRTHPLSISIRPNPAHATAMLDIVTNRNVVVDIEVNNLVGSRAILQLGGVQVASGASAIPLDVTTLAAGMYLCLVRTPESVSTCYFMVE